MLSWLTYFQLFFIFSCYVLVVVLFIFRGLFGYFYHTDALHPHKNVNLLLSISYFANFKQWAVGREKNENQRNHRTARGILQLACGGTLSSQKEHKRSPTTWFDEEMTNVSRPVSERNNSPPKAF
eukprot:g3785.t1